MLVEALRFVFNSGYLKGVEVKADIAPRFTHLPPGTLRAWPRLALPIYPIPPPDRPLPYLPPTGPKICFAPLHGAVVITVRQVINGEHDPK